LKKFYFLKKISIIFLFYISVIFFIFNLFGSIIYGQDSNYSKDVLMNSIFSIQFDSNSWIIQTIDKDYLTLVSKDIAYDTVSFHFKPKKVGQTTIEFYDMYKKGIIKYNINISENVQINPSFAFSLVEGTNISNNSNSTSYFDIAFFLFSNGMYQDAINYFIKGRENEPLNFQKIGESKIAYYLGVCYFNLKQYNVASSYFAQAKNSTINDIQIYSYYYMAKTQIMLKNYDLALDNLFLLIYYEKKDYEHIILLIYPKIDILDKSIFKDYFNYFLAISYYDGRKDFLTAYSFLKKITNSSFEYYNQVQEMIKNIETNFIDFH
jgi:tetratricopeptide (TPR) repeat protein